MEVLERLPGILALREADKAVALVDLRLRRDGRCLVTSLHLLNLFFFDVIGAVPSALSRVEDLAADDLTKRFKESLQGN